MATIGRDCIRNGTIRRNLEINLLMKLLEKLMKITKVVRLVLDKVRQMKK